MTDRLFMAVALENTAAGTHMACAKVDPDRTARIELVERRDVGWWNITTESKTTSLDMAAEFDDMVVTRLPESVDSGVHA